MNRTKRRYVKYLRHCKIALGGVLLAIGVAGCFGGDPNAPATFSKSYGGTNHDGFSHAISTEDGGYAAVGVFGGQSESDPEIGGALLFSKLDEFGDIQWQVAMGQSVAEGLVNRRYALSSDEGFCVAANEIQENGGSNIYLARLDSTGFLAWESRLDSGEWGGYQFFEGGGNGPSAGSQDKTVQVVAVSGGGCAAIFESTADLVDTGGVGFGGLGRGSGDIFLGAVSTVVVYADGGNNWVRRLPEGAFGEAGSRSFGQQGRNIQATTQGFLVSFSIPDERFSSLLSPEYTNWKTLVAHYGPNGNLQHRAVLDLLPIPTVVAGTIVPRAAGPEGNFTGVTQTDDPDANGRRDGVADDGFVLHFSGELIKLDRTLAVEWRQALDLSGDSVNFSSFLFSQNNSDRLLHFRGDSIGVFDLDDGRPITETLEPMRGRFHDVIEVQPGRYRALFRSGSGLAGDYDLLDLSWVGAEPPTENSRVTVNLSGRFRGSPRLRNNGLYTFELGLGELELRDDAGSRVAVLGRSRMFSFSTGLTVAEVTTGTYWVGGRISRVAFVAAVRNGSVVWQQRFPEYARVSYIETDGSGGGVLLLSSRDSFQLFGLATDGSENWVSDRVDAFASFQQPRVLRGWSDGYVVTSASNIWRFDRNGSPTATHQVPQNILDVRETDDGGVILAGYNGASGNRGLPTLVRLDANGDRVWHQQAGLRGASREEDSPARVLQLSDGDFAMAFVSEALLNQGFSDADGPIRFGDRNVALMRFSALGEPIWARVYGALNAEHLSSLESTPDGGFLIAGRSDSFGERGESWLLRLGPDGRVNDGCNAYLGMVAGAHFRNDSLMSQPEIESPVPPNSAIRPVVMQTANLVANDPEVVVARQCSGRAALTDTANTVPVDLNTLAVSQAGSVPGLVTSTPNGIFCGGSDPQFCTMDVAAGSGIVLRVDDSSSSRFRGWGSNVCTEELRNPYRCVIEMTFDFDLDVFFEPDDGAIATLTVDVLGAGRIFTSDTQEIRCIGGVNSGDCVETYPLGQRVDLLVAADAGESFQGWAGDCSQWGTATRIVVDMDRDKSCTAMFSGTPPVVETFRLDVAMTLDGTPTTAEGMISSIPTGINCGGSGTACSNLYSAGTSVDLRAIARNSAVFDRWTSSVAGSGCDNVANSGVTVVMDRALTCTANFISPATSTGSVTMDLVVGGVPRTASQWGGFVTSVPAGMLCGALGTFDQCTASYDLNRAVEFDVAEQAGWVFRSWGGVDPGCPSGTTFPTTITVSQLSLRCEAVFDPSTTNDVTVLFDGYAGRVFDQNTGQLDCTATCTVALPVSESPIRLRVVPPPNNLTGCDSVQNIDGGVLCSIDITNGPVSVLLE